MDNINQLFLASAIKRVTYYKEIADKAMAQLSDADFLYRPNNESNSIALIIQHMYGNMLSRRTDCLTTDGEKEWRNRDTEFEAADISKADCLQHWQKGWDCFLNALNSLQEADLVKTIYIRHEPLTVVDAINRQLAHYPYHVGQIIYIAKAITGAGFQSLSIPIGGSAQYNDKLKNGPV